MASKNFNYELSTRAGLLPNERELPFSITTSDVESYLQSKIDVVNAKEGSNTVVRVYTTEVSRSFLPFVVVLPLDVIADGEDKKNDNNVSSLFVNNDDDSKRVNLKEPYFKIFEPFIYNKNDENMFFADSWRREHDISRDKSPVLKSQRTAKINSLENGRLKVVTFMIDPLRVFHDMLIIPTDNRQFAVQIDDWQKIQTGEFRFELVRNIRKGKNGKKYKNTVAEELNRVMRGNR